MEEKGFGRDLESLEQPDRGQASSAAKSLSWSELNEVRVGKYQANRGLFLVYSWKPCDNPDQVADVVISIAQHSGHGPLSDGTIRGVQYTLGPKFSEHSHVITDPMDGFCDQCLDVRDHAVPLLRSVLRTGCPRFSWSATSTLTVHGDAHVR